MSNVELALEIVRMNHGDDLYEKAKNVLMIALDDTRYEVKVENKMKKTIFVSIKEEE